MRIIKNFFHNISDILLALVIVCVAAGIIYWRMNIILEYPEQLAAEQANYETIIETDAAEEDASDEDAATEEEGSGDAAEGEADSGVDADADEEPKG